MAILEDIFEELKLLNNNLRVLNTELSTVDSSIVQEKVKEAPMPKEETAQLESIEEVKETSADLTKDYVLSVGKEFLKKQILLIRKNLEINLTNLVRISYLLSKKSIMKKLLIL
ncbi:phage protein [Staphylococcus aureus T66243]|nr:phage protein [Staphylococcus aureus T66243]EWH86782.1 phage protein [Staphylococcus aureus W75132]EWI00747.1 phage protein [Staphylococcus aureus M49691]EWI29509.1 phage protein [Staphylococcus aureus W50092]EWX67690.1 phage protein [Staphylococcus aureus H65794]